MDTESSQLHQVLEQLFCEVLGLDSSEFSGQASRKSAIEWDSLRHVELFIKIRKSLVIDLDAGLFMQISNYCELEDLVFSSMNPTNV